MVDMQPSMHYTAVLFGVGFFHVKLANATEQAMVCAVWQHVMEYLFSLGRFISLSSHLVKMCCQKGERSVNQRSSFR